VVFVTVSKQILSIRYLLAIVVYTADRGHPILWGPGIHDSAAYLKTAANIADAKIVPLLQAAMDLTGEH
jgi:hypothetical protein